MSRCFPFPPPGYEKRPRSGEHGDLLAKEKHKEKKHKKEKDKERKDKDKSKDKHKEKKERKEKHKDQKKDKDRDKERDKASEDQRTEIHHKTNEFRDSKFTEELGRRIRHEEQGATNRMVEDISATPNRTIESMGTSTSMVNKTPTNVTVTIQRNEKLTPSFHNRTEIMEISMSTEKQKATNSQKVHDITSTERRRNEYVIPQLHKKTETMEKQRAANSGKVGHFTNLVAKTESMFSVNSIQSKRVTGNNLVSNTIGSSTNRNDHTMENLTSIPRRIESAGAEPAMEKERFVFPNVTGTEKKTEGKEKSKEKRAEDDKREGHKDRERKEKKRKKEKDKNRDKEKKKEEKKKGKREHRHSKHDKLKENEVKDQIPNLNNKTLAPHAENVNASGADGPNKRKKEFEGNPDRSDGPNNKRKEFKMNGFLRESQHDGRPNKLPRTSVASFHHPVENGRPTEFASGNPAGSDGPNNKRKEFEMNGFLHESQHDGQLSKLPRTSVASFHHPVENVRPTEFASGNPDGSDGPNNKRKEFEMNGFLHESQHDGRPSKLPRTNVTSFHHPVENGRPTEFASGNPYGSDGPNNKRKEFEMNGFLHESQHDGRPSKLPRTSVTSFHHPVENGRPMEFASGKPDGSDGPNNKRKEFEINGFLNESQHDGRPSKKLPRTSVTSFHHPVENGRPMEFASGNPDGSDGPNNKRKEFEMNGFLHESQHPMENGRPAEFAPIKLRGINNTKVERGLDNNGKYINGKVEVQPSPLPKPPIPPVVKPSRLPHPDTKYLSTIYTVPKMEDLLEPDDLEWLFNGKKPPATKVEADGTPPRVGATGLQIESADVFALPYVIPL